MGTSRQYFFGEFRLDAVQRGLFRKDELVSLTPKALETLLFLVERHGRIVDKKELMEAVWPDTFVEEVSLARNVSILRKILSENEEGQSYIETIPKRGYRFVAPVQQQAEGNAQEERSVFIRAEGKVPRVLRRSWRGWPGVVLLLLVIAGGMWYWRRGTTQNAMAPPRIMLAVLPVQNLSGDAGREYVTDGLTEELIARLGAMNPDRLGIIARTSSMAYKGTPKTADQIGRELGVEYLLETSMRPNGERMRFTAQLIRARDQTHVWAQDYDESPSDVITMEDRVALSVIEHIRLELPPASQERLANAHPVDPAAHDFYLKGRYAQSTRSKEGLAKSLEYFQEAIQRDPRNAQAYAGIADSLNLENFYGYSPGAGTIINAQTAAQKAIQLDNALAEGHAAMAYLNFMWLWDWPTAEREFQTAIQLNRNYAPAHHWYALYLAAMDRRPEAVKEIRLAESLDPVSPIVNTAVGYVYFFNRDYDEAIKDCRKVLERDPNFLVAHTVLGRAYDAKGMHDVAIAELERAIELAGGRPASYLANLGHAYAVAGRPEDARRMLDQMYEMTKQGFFVGLSARAIIYAGLGDKENAIVNLQRARDQNDANMIWLHVEPAYDGLRSDPRFQELVRQQGIPPQ
jgi:TolB-like protein/DNA-binding winged helix-turn-helix (wHTH) protein/Tfp pilus assembly protein PilF